MLGKREVGRSQNNWRRSIQKEMEEVNKTWNQVEEITKDRKNGKS